MPDVVVVQELVGYLKQEGHLEGEAGSGMMQAPNLDQLINLLQRSQVCTCMSPTLVLQLLCVDIDLLQSSQVCICMSRTRFLQLLSVDSPDESYRHEW